MAQLDSDLFASPIQDSFLSAEILNDNFRNLINYKLDYVLDPKKDCKKLEHNTSMLTIYGINDLDQMQTKEYFPCSFNASEAMADLSGFKSVYIQFYRETKNPNSKMNADKFIIYFNLKLVNCKCLSCQKKT